jgi:UDP-N-acetylmuramoylalanine--D-glutamate ligase
MAAVAWQDEEDVVVERDGMSTLIVGLGATGLAVARHLASLGGPLLAIDSRAAPPGLASLRAQFPDLPVKLQTLDTSCLEGVGRVVLSPGLSVDLPLVIEARRRGIAVISDIELFAAQADAPVLTVTGSNGKSTVATLLQAILQARGLTVPTGGNLGPPALELLHGEPAADAYVLEISSFQMETTDSLRPLAAAVLNVSPDHLDRHGSLERYAELKAKLLETAEHAIFNWDDPLVRSMGERHARPIPFSVHEPLTFGYSAATLDGERWLLRGTQKIMPAAELGLFGGHNESNALAALALSDVLAGPADADRDVLRSFKGLPHRCQWLASKAGVTYVNDSKGTNVGAAVAALEGSATPVVLLAGGQGKGADFAALATAAKHKLRGAVLIGEAAQALAIVLGPVCDIAFAADMAQAVQAAAALAQPGDTVLLSPACASQDMFLDYRARGDAFAQAVAELPE